VRKTRDRVRRDMPETEAGKAAAAATLKEYAGVIVVE
jgi:hypothetical protein